MLRALLSDDLPRSRWLAVVLVASYDLLLGYTGIVSFAHTMFFGIGGYGVAIAMSRMEPGWAARCGASTRRR